MKKENKLKSKGLLSCFQLKPLVQIAIEYQYNCEVYDQYMCSGVDRYGDARPTNNCEYMNVQKNGLRERNKAISKAVKLGYDRNDLLKEIIEASRYSFSELKELVNR